VKLVLLEKVVDAHSEKLGDDTNVITMVESLDQVDAFPASQSVSYKAGIGDRGRSCHNALSVGWVAFLEELEDTDLNIRGLAVFWNGANNLHSDLSRAGEVCGRDDLAKCALTEEAHDAIWHDGRGVRRGTAASLGTHIDRQ